MERSIVFICFILFFSGLNDLYSQELKTRKDTISYAAGVSIATSFQRHGAGDLDVTLITKAIQDVMLSDKVNKVLIDKKVCQKLFDDYVVDIKRLPGRNFLNRNANEDGVVVLPSGLQYKIVKKAGKGGEKAKISDTVKVHYTGKLTDGTIFDSSKQSGEPSEFPVNKVIKGWIEGLQLMEPGDQFTFYIPTELGYGDRGAGSKIPPYAALVFDIELIEIVKK